MKRFGLPEISVIIVLLSTLAIVLLGLYLRHRKLEMAHRERLASLEKGVAIPTAEPAPWSPRVYLLRGLIWSFTGAAIVIAMVFLALATERPQSPLTVAYRTRDIASALNIPIDQARQIAEKDDASAAHGMPVSVSLLGLIPLAVGLAYLVYYRSEASRNLQSRERQ